MECAQLNQRLIHAHRRTTLRFHSMSEHCPTSTKPIPVLLSRVMRPHSEHYVGGVGGGEEVGREEGEGEGEEGGVEEVDLGEEGEEEEGGEEDEGGEGEGGERGSGSDHSTVRSSEMEVEETDGGLTHSPSSSLGSSSSLPREDTPRLTRKGSLLSLPFLGRKTSRKQHTTPHNTNTSPRQQPQAPPPSSAPSNPVLNIARSVAAAAAAVSSSPPLDSDPDCVYVDLPPIFATRYLHFRHSSNTYIGYVFKVIFLFFLFFFRSFSPVFLPFPSFSWYFY